MKKYMTYLFRSLFADILYKGDMADRMREKFTNYKQGYGYIDHDELQEQTGIFIDEIKVDNSGGSVSLRTSDRAMKRWQKTPEARAMYEAAENIVNNK